MATAHQAGGTALIWDGGRWSGPEMLAHAAFAGAWLADLGLPSGQPIPALLDLTSPAAIALTVGGAAVRRPLAPLGARLTARELAPASAGLSCPVLLTEAGAESTARQVAELTGQRVVVIPDLSPSDAELPDPGPQDIAGHLHTSGTSGTPKLVPLRQDRLAHRARVHGDLIGIGPGDCFVTASPWHHIAGMGNVAAVLARGATILALPRFDLDTWQRAERLGATHSLLVPSMIEMLLARGALRPGSVRVLIYGSAPIHPGTLRRLLDELPGVAVVNLYGLTEGSPLTSLSADDHRLALDHRPELLNSCGRAVPGLELRVADPDDTGEGEVWVRGPHVMLADADGWLRTGDLGRLDDDGYLFLSGRLGDKIIRGGENVHPLEVENVLATHPAVAEAGVVGLPDRRLGQTVAAFVVPAVPEDPPEPDALATYARERLAGFKVPTTWRFVSAMPRTASGKLQRRLLTDLVDDRGDAG